MVDMANIAASSGVNAQTGAAAAQVQDEFLSDADLWSRMRGLNPLEITADTLLDFSTHNGRVLQVNSASTVTLTIPGSLAAGFSIAVDQVGAGKALFAVSGGATKVNRQGFDRTAGQHAIMNMYIRSNASGSNAVAVLAGDGASS